MVQPAECGRAAYILRRRQQNARDVPGRKQVSSVCCIVRQVRHLPADSCQKSVEERPRRTFSGGAHAAGESEAQTRRRACGRRYCLPRQVGRLVTSMKAEGVRLLPAEERRSVFNHILGTGFDMLQTAPRQRHLLLMEDKPVAENAICGIMPV